MFSSIFKAKNLEIKIPGLSTIRGNPVNYIHDSEGKHNRMTETNLVYPSDQHSNLEPAAAA